MEKRIVMDFDEKNQSWSVEREGMNEVEYIGLLTILLDTTRNNRAMRMIELLKVKSPNNE